MRRFELPGLILLAASLRILVLFLWSPELSGDASDYDRLARALVEGRGFVNTKGELTSWRPPLYPAFIAASYLFSGGSIQVVRYLQGALDLGTVACTYAIGRLLFGRAPGLVAALLVTLNMGTVAATGRLLSETLFTFLLVAGVAVSVAWVQSINAGRITVASALGFAAGILLGAGSLTRGTLLLYPLFLVGLVIAGMRVWRSAPGEIPSVPGSQSAGLLGSICLILAFVMILTPWSIRNYRVHHAFIPVATQLGATLYGSYNPPQGWIFGIHPEDGVTEAAGRLRESAASAALAHAAVDAILASPLRAVKLEAFKALYFWAPFDWEILPVYGAFNLTYAFIALWAIAYVGSHGQRGNVLATGAAWLPVLYLFGVALVFYGSPRFRLPAEPLLAVFAAVRLVSLNRRVGRWTSTATVGGTVAFLILISVFVAPVKQFVKERILAPGKSGRPAAIGQLQGGSTSSSPVRLKTG